MSDCSSPPLSSAANFAFAQGCGTEQRMHSAGIPLLPSVKLVLRAHVAGSSCRAMIGQMSCPKTFCTAGDTKTIRRATVGTLL